MIYSLLIQLESSQSYHSILSLTYCRKVLLFQLNSYRRASQIVLHDYLCQFQSQSERGFSIQLLDEGWRATLEPVSFGRKELSVAFSSMFLLVTFHEMLIWNNVRGLGKESLRCFCWHRQACQQEFGRTTQFGFSLWICISLASAVHLTCTELEMEVEKVVSV